MYNGNWHSRPSKEDELRATTSDKVVVGVVVAAWIVVGILLVFEVI